MTTKIKVFKSVDANALAKMINDDKLNFFASQIYSTVSGWTAFCYYHEDN